MFEVLLFFVFFSPALSLEGYSDNHPEISLVMHTMPPTFYKGITIYFISINCSENNSNVTFTRKELQIEYEVYKRTFTTLKEVMCMHVPMFFPVKLHTVFAGVQDDFFGPKKHASKWGGHLVHWVH